MNRRTRLLLPTAAITLAAVLGACTTTRGPASVPTAERTGQSWVVTRPIIAAQVLDTCSRPSPGREAGRVSGYWAPSRQQIDQLEANLSSLEAQVPKVLDFDRQYVGIESAGRRLIYINAFHLPDDSGINPAREAIRVCDGGAQFWGAAFEPARRIMYLETAPQSDSVRNQKARLKSQSAPTISPSSAGPKSIRSSAPQNRTLVAGGVSLRKRSLGFCFGYGHIDVDGGRYEMPGAHSLEPFELVDGLIELSFDGPFVSEQSVEVVRIGDTSELLLDLYGKSVGLFFLL